MARNAQDKRAVQVEEEESTDVVDGVAVVAKFPRQLSPYTLDVRRWREDLCKLVSDISIFTKLVSLDEDWLKNNYELMDTFCSHLPPTLKKYLNMVHGDAVMIIEMIVSAVEFVIAISHLVIEDHSMLPLFLKLVKTIRIVLDEKNGFYKNRHGQGYMKFQIVLNESRLWKAERNVCGLYVGSPGDSKFYPSGCRCKRWNLGVLAKESCSACIEGARTDAVVTYIRWLLLDDNLYGYTYLWLLDVLKSFPDDDTSQDLYNLLRPYALLCISFGD